MSIKLKIIKTKEFEAAGLPQKHYTCAYKGRVFGVSTLRFQAEDADKLSVAGDILTISGDIEPLKHVSTDQVTGETRTFIDLVPKLGMVLADF